MKKVVVCSLLLFACGPRSVPGKSVDTEPADTTPAESVANTGQQSVPEQVVTVVPSLPENVNNTELTPEEPGPPEEPSTQPSSVPVEEPASQPDAPTGPTGATGSDDDEDEDECSSDKWCKGHKVLMCHKQKCRKPKEICIDRHAIKAHKKHGDYRGLCR